MKIIGHIRTDFQTKFGLPRQSGLIEELTGRIEFEPEFRQPEAFRGLDGFSHLWLLWQFSENKKTNWSATVKPPRLGGKVRMGVFATRSPYRPNDIGLSCVKLLKIDFEETGGPFIYVGGIDLMDNTPIYDIKPYLPYADCHPEATGGFAAQVMGEKLTVQFLNQTLEMIPKGKQEALTKALAQDPRPAYEHKEEQIYKIAFSGLDVKFTVSNNILSVFECTKLQNPDRDMS